MIACWTTSLDTDSSPAADLAWLKLCRRKGRSCFFSKSAVCQPACPSKRAQLIHWFPSFHGEGKFSVGKPVPHTRYSRPIECYHIYWRQQVFWLGNKYASCDMMLVTSSFEGPAPSLSAPLTYSQDVELIKAWCNDHSATRNVCHHLVESRSGNWAPWWREIHGLHLTLRSCNLVATELCVMIASLLESDWGEESSSDNVRSRCVLNKYLLLFLSVGRFCLRSQAGPPLKCYAALCDAKDSVLFLITKTRRFLSSKLHFTPWWRNTTVYLIFLNGPLWNTYSRSWKRIQIEAAPKTYWKSSTDDNYCPSWNFPEIDAFLGVWDAGIDRKVELAKLTSRGL